MQGVTKFGQLLGVSRDGTAAYSNGQGAFVSTQSNYQHELLTGLKWQCVEYARRWFYNNHKLIFDDVDFAFDIWYQINSFYNPATLAKVATKNYSCPNQVAPEVGDLLVYNKGYLGTGHVAIIDSVDLGKGLITVIEANYENTLWPSNFSRAIPLDLHNDGFGLNEPYLLGWKRVASGS